MLSFPYRLIDNHCIDDISLDNLVRQNNLEETKTLLDRLDILARKDPEYVKLHNTNLKVARFNFSDACELKFFHLIDCAINCLTFFIGDRLQGRNRYISTCCNIHARDISASNNIAITFGQKTYLAPSFSRPGRQTVFCDNDTMLINTSQNTAESVRKGGNYFGSSILLFDTHMPVLFNSSHIENSLVAIKHPENNVMAVLSHSRYVHFTDVDYFKEVETKNAYGIY